MTVLVKRLNHRATFYFGATFVGSPVSVTAKLSYMKLSDGTIATETLTLTQTGGVGPFEATWDSAVANPNSPCYWNVRGHGVNEVSEVGRIDFDHNPATLLAD